MSLTPTPAASSSVSFPADSSPADSSRPDSPRALPVSISWEQLRKQAKELQRAHQKREAGILERLRAHFPPLREASDEAVFAAPFPLAEAKIVIAREYGIASWPRLKAHVEAHIKAQNERVLDEFKSGVRNGQASTVRALLQKHTWLQAQVNAPLFDFGGRALIAARGNRDMVELLLEYGADINAKSEWWAGGFGVLDGADEETAAYLLERGAQLDVFAAAELGRLEALRELLEADPALVDAKGPDGQRALHRAKTPEVIDFLLERGADIEARDVDHNGTPAQYAINEEAKLRHLLQRGATPDIWMACVLGDVEMARHLLEAGPDALAARIGQEPFVGPGEHIYVYELGNTARPLTLAARRGHHELVQFLLSRADLKQQFLFACQTADRKRIKVLLGAQPQLMQQLDESERSLICDAAWHNDAPAVEAMIEVGFDINALSSNQSTPLDRAAIRGYVETIKVLLAHGADFTLTNEFGGTPLGACAWGSIHFRDPVGDYPAVIEALIAAGSALPGELFGSDDVQAVLRRHGVPEPKQEEGEAP
ncbi:MAG: hypothetical protein JWN98_1038 [Abditibacteriota bacterium]|nr:hypothetical protein [Abditibacteriota bacterium]